jgi:hypothetical protein
LLAAAKAQVEAAQAEEESAPDATRVKRALEIDDKDEGEQIPVKRSRVDELERQVWYDDKIGKALLGIAVGLGVRYTPFPSLSPLSFFFRNSYNTKFDMDTNSSVVLPYLT